MDACCPDIKPVDDDDWFSSSSRRARSRHFKTSARRRWPLVIASQRCRHDDRDTRGVGLVTKKLNVARKVSTASKLPIDETRAENGRAAISNAITISLEPIAVEMPCVPNKGEKFASVEIGRLCREARDRGGIWRSSSMPSRSMISL